MKSVKEGIFCPEQALILNDITDFLGKFDPSQWVVSGDEGARAVVAATPG